MPLKKRFANSVSSSIFALKSARAISRTLEFTPAVTVADGGCESTNDISPTSSPRRAGLRGVLWATQQSRRTPRSQLNRGMAHPRPAGSERIRTESPAVSNWLPSIQHPGRPEYRGRLMLPTFRFPFVPATRRPDSGRPSAADQTWPASDVIVSTNGTVYFTDYLRRRKNV